MATATTTTPDQLHAAAAATAGTPAHALYAPSVAANPIPNPVDVAGQVLDPIAGVLDPLKQIEAFVVDRVNWQRITKVIIGLSLVAIGAVGLTYTGVFKPTSRVLFGGLRKVDREVTPWADRYGPVQPQPRKP